MQGMSATTGARLSGVEHLRQSITDILTTPIGTRVMRRDYGSLLPRLVDAPLNASTRIDLISATAEALAIWEPRIEVLSVAVSSAEGGRVSIDLEGNYLPDGIAITIDGIIVQ